MLMGEDELVSKLKELVEDLNFELELASVDAKGLKESEEIFANAKRLRERYYTIITQYENSKTRK